jgi:adenylate kinase
MFESMRVYIERNGRSYNYLPSIKKLNVEREDELVKEEKDFKSEKESAAGIEKDKSEAEKAALEKLQDGRLASIKAHMEELESTSNLNMRQFLMKQIIPVLTEGMIDVYRVGPTDPVDYLADYIFAKSNMIRKSDKKKKSAK